MSNTTDRLGNWLDFIESGCSFQTKVAPYRCTLRPRTMDFENPPKNNRMGINDSAEQLNLV
ncbi:MAG: hypothetical protein OXG56_05045 [Gammaproteobacteria bacterium]|nr:hypothetical protein [Gammaproteobacteria bacterium]